MAVWKWAFEVWLVWQRFYPFSNFYLECLALVRREPSGFPDATYQRVRHSVDLVTGVASFRIHVECVADFAKCDETEGCNVGASDFWSSERISSKLETLNVAVKTSCGFARLNAFVLLLVR